MSNTGTSKFKSPNCEGRAESTALYSFHATNKNEPSQEMHSFMLSCQADSTGKPDATTMRAMKQVASELMSKEHSKEMCADDVRVSAQAVQLAQPTLLASATEIATHRMASSCAPGYNVNGVTSHNRFTCRYMGKGLDEDGNWVQNPFQTWRGSLASCDSSLEISKDLVDDIKKLAWHAAGGADSEMDKDQFLCQVHSIPIQ